MENSMHLSKVGAGLALASTLVIAFVLCAIVQLVLPGVQFSHMWLQLFTAVPLGSLQAWVEGITVSLAIGFILGWCFAHCYNWAVSRK